MTIQLLAVIAQLCLTPNGYQSNSSYHTLPDIADFHNTCQVYYVKCVKKAIKKEPYGDPADHLAVCVEKKQ